VRVCEGQLFYVENLFLSYVNFNEMFREDVLGSLRREGSSSFVLSIYRFQDLFFLLLFLADTFVKGD